LPKVNPPSWPVVLRELDLVLPVTDWEAPEHRVVLPSSLQDALGYETPILRWSRAKRARNIRDHPADLVVIERLNDVLPLVERAGPDFRPGRCESLAFLWHESRLYRVVVGPDRSGSFNVVSVYGTDRAAEIRRWMRDMWHGRMKDVK
jgi:hypothetical protein